MEARTVTVIPEAIVGECRLHCDKFALLLFPLMIIGDKDRPRIAGYACSDCINDQIRRLEGEGFTIKDGRRALLN
jgi:hypothetical protein